MNDTIDFGDGTYLVEDLTWDDFAPVVRRMEADLGPGITIGGPWVAPALEAVLACPSQISRTRALDQIRRHAPHLLRAMHEFSPRWEEVEHFLRECPFTLDAENPLPELCDGFVVVLAALWVRGDLGGFLEPCT